MDTPTHPMAILLVDDDSATLRLLSYTLRKLAPGYTIVTAEDAQGALLQLAEYQVALLVTDYLLPDMNGVQLAAAIKTASPTTYVVLASADDSLQVKQLARAASVDLFLSKLDLLDRLGDVVRRVLPVGQEPKP